MGAAVLAGARQLLARLADVADWPIEEVTASDGRLRRGSQRIRLAELVARAGGTITVEGTFNLAGGANVNAGPAEVATRTFGVVFVEVGVERGAWPGTAASRDRCLQCRADHQRAHRALADDRRKCLGLGDGDQRSQSARTTARTLALQNLAGVALPVNADIPAAIDIAFIDETDDAAGPSGRKASANSQRRASLLPSPTRSSTPSASASASCRSRPRGFMEAAG